MAIGFGTATQADIGSAGDEITVTAPTHNNGDHLLAVVGGGGGTWPDPAFDALTGQGFTEVENIGAVDGRDRGLAVGWLVASSEPASYTFAIAGTTSGIDRWGIVLPITGADAGLFDVTYVQANHYTSVANDPTPTNDAITTLTDNAVVLLIHQCTHDALTAVAPTGYTIRADNTNAANRNGVIASKLVASAGLETPGAWAHTGGNAASEGMTITLALKIAAVGGTAVPVFYHQQARHWRKI